MRTACIYHSIDLDGWMSAAIVKKWYMFGNSTTNGVENTDDIDFIGYNYGQPVPDLSGYDKVIMCDISFPFEHLGGISKSRMFQLFQKLDTNFIWIDHHISAIKDNIGEGYLDSEGKDTSTLFNGLRNTNYAACELTWKYFFPNETMPEIVRLLGRYDCFGHKGTDEEKIVLEFQYGARSVISNYEEAYNILTSKDLNTYEENIYTRGQGIYQYLCTEAKTIYKQGKEIVLGEPLDNELGLKIKRFIAINRERFNPINFGINYHDQAYDGVMSYYYNKNKWYVSLYNDDGKTDCSKIAKSYGGGGHKGAAGFTVENITELLK